MFDGLPGFEPGREPLLPGFGHLHITGGTEDQRGIDVDAEGDQFADHRQAGVGGRNLDHDVGPIHGLPQAQGLANGRGRVVGQFRRDFQADQAIDPAAAFVHRPQGIGGQPDVFPEQGFV